MGEKHPQSWYYNQASSIQQQVKDIADVKAIQFAVQATFKDTNLKITFWYRKHTYHSSLTRKMAKFLQGNEANIILKHAEELKQVFTYPKKAVVVSEQKDKGTQACIDHIIKKIALAKEIKGNDNAVVAMLLNLSKELEQYL